MPTPKKKLPWWAILLIIFGVLALLGITGIGGIVWWVSANKDRLAGEGQKAIVEGSAYAKDHDQSACVDEGLRRGDACDGIMCEAMTKMFMTQCVQKALPTSGFCSGVPEPTEFVKTGHWVVDECQRRGKPNNQRCTRLVQLIPESCHKR